VLFISEPDVPDLTLFATSDVIQSTWPLLEGFAEGIVIEVIVDETRRYMVRK